MCGICGFTYSDKSLVKKMSLSLRHRGPDDEGIHVTNDVSLGHRRLSILDLSVAGHQPMANRDKTLWIVHNGEVYNFREIRKELEAKGYTFQGNSDTEVILYAYEEWGADCLQRFRGMFAFAIWNEQKKDLFIARDRLGVKPLYYMEKGGILYFASEIKAFKETGVMDDTLHAGAVDLYFTFRFTPGSQTVIKDVKRLDPGYYMIWKEGASTLHKYWDIDLNFSSHITKKREEDYVEEFLHIFRESVGLRLVSDVPVGAYLSGGLDSSFIVAIMSEIAGKQVSTFSVGLPGGRDESGYAKIVAQYFNTDHHPLQVESSAADKIPDVMWHLDEPLSDAATIPTYLMSEVTKKEVTVILSGEGADEQLGGYDKYKPLYYPYLFKSLIPGFLLKSLSPHLSGSSTSYRAMEYMANLRDPAKAYLRFNSVFLREQRKTLFSDSDVEYTCPGDNDYNIVAPYLNGKGDYLNRLLLLDLKTWLPHDLLLKNDKMTMAFGVEARTPFLDHRLAELLIKVPARYKLKWFKEKHLLRKAMAGKVPHEILKRKKQGFTVPIERWVKGELRALTDELFSRESLESTGIFDFYSAQKVKEANLSNIYSLRQFWTLFSFLAWNRYFLKR